MGDVIQTADGSEIEVHADIAAELVVLPGLLLERREQMPTRGFRWVSIDVGFKETTIVVGTGMMGVDHGPGHTRIKVHAPVDVAAWVASEVIHTIRPQYGMIDTTGVGLALYQQLGDLCRDVHVDLHRLPGLDRR